MDRVLAVRSALPLVALAAAVACDRQPPVTVEFTFAAPPAWTDNTPTSSMRVAEYTLPRVEGDEEDAAVVVYFFGEGAGSVQANLDRWVGQMEQADGSPSADAAEISTMTAPSGLQMTLVDVSGTYVAEVVPGSTERYNTPGFRLRAAVIDTPLGPYYVKLTGPAATVERWDAGFLALLHSMQVE